MPKEIIITDANNFHSFISFRINGLKDGIIVGIVPDPNSHGQALSIAYKGEVKIVPLNASTEDINELNSDENVIKPSRLKENDKITTTLSMGKETYDWLTTPSEDDDIGYWQPSHMLELDDEAYDEFEKEIRNTEPDMERVGAAKKIVDGVKDIPVVRDYEQTHYGEPHLLELMDEWGVNGTNYEDFRSVIREHCLSKGLYAFADIEKAWKEHIKSSKKCSKNIIKNKGVK